MFAVLRELTVWKFYNSCIGQECPIVYIYIHICFFPPNLPELYFTQKSLYAKIYVKTYRISNSESKESVYISVFIVQAIPV